MAATFKLMRDWIVHALGDVGKFVTTSEIETSLADITREIQGELTLRECLTTGDISYTLANQYGTLPTDCLQLERLSKTESDEEVFIDILDYKAIGRRLHYHKIGRGYAYVLGRTLHLSWQVTADMTLKAYYIPMWEAASLPADDTTFGSSADVLPPLLQKALRYGVLADLMSLHGMTQIHESKAARWDAYYRNLVTRAKQNVREHVPPYEISKIRDY